MMRNMPLPDGCSESHKHVPQKVGSRQYAFDATTDQVMLDYLLDNGFQWEEAVTLLRLREHLYENAEMHQRITDDLRMQFVKWLYEHDMLSDT